LLSAVDVTFAYGTPGRGAGSRPSFRATPHAAGRPVLAGVSLTVPAGALVGVLGPNGSGKTTLLRLLAGMLRPLSGRISFGDRDMSTMSRAAIARALAVVPQETHPAFEYSVLEMVLMGRYPHLGALEIEGPEDLRIAREAMAMTGTTSLEERRYDTLSGGEKQRVVIASALAQSARVLLLDEPTSSLDLNYQLEIAAVISRLNREHGTTIVLSTHDLNFAASVCRTMVLLRDGRIVAAGPTRDVLTPANIRAVYGVEADVSMHDRAGHLAVMPIRLAEQRGGMRDSSPGSPGERDVSSAQGSPGGRDFSPAGGRDR
jgi:iron complex transport system ATP-binding protein